MALRPAPINMMNPKSQIWLDLRSHYCLSDLCLKEMAKKKPFALHFFFIQFQGNKYANYYWSPCSSIFAPYS
jgi:hypothetical protein